LLLMGKNNSRKSELQLIIDRLRRDLNFMLNAEYRARESERVRA
jgi:hypothetical protein